MTEGRRQGGDGIRRHHTVSAASSAPADLDTYSDLLLWTRSGVGVTIDTVPTPDVLYQWDNQASASHNLLSASSSNGMDVNAAAQNGLDTYGPSAAGVAADNLDCDASRIAQADLASSGSDPVTMLIVAARGTGQHGALGITNGGSFNTIGDIFFNSATDLRIRGRGSAGMQDTGSYTLSDTNYHTIMGVIKSAAIELYVDGVKVTELTTGFTFTPTATLDRVVTLGSIGPNLGYSTQGNVGEIAIWGADHGASAAAIHSAVSTLRWSL